MSTEAPRREQLYVCIARFAAESAGDKPDVPHDVHRAYLQDLFDAGLLVGSGPARDEHNVNHAAAVFILRAASLGEARSIAELEPNVRAGLRTVEIIPWQRAWFAD